MLSSDAYAAMQTLRMIEVIEKLKQKGTILPLADPSFKDQRYQAEKLNIKNFHPIPPTANDSTLCFVDGGSLKVSSAPKFAVKLHRLYLNLYRNNKRLRANKLPQRIHFHTICYAVSNFTKFAIPIQIPDFNELASRVQPQGKKVRTGFV